MPQNKQLETRLASEIQTCLTNSRLLDSINDGTVFKFEGPFSIPVMDKGFEYTETLVKEVQEFLKLQGVKSTVTKITHLSLLSASINKPIGQSKGFNKLIASETDSGEVEVLILSGDFIEEVK